jgi:hypothetical protein
VRDVDFDATDAGTVLAAVVLFLHEEEELVEAVKRRAVFGGIMTEVFEEADKSNAAFVFDRVTHEKAAQGKDVAGRCQVKMSLEMEEAEGTGLKPRMNTNGHE